MVAPLIAALLAGGAGLTAGHLMSRPDAQPVAPTAPGLVPFDNTQIAPNTGNAATDPNMINSIAEQLGTVNNAVDPGFKGLDLSQDIAPFDASKNAPAPVATPTTAVPEAPLGDQSEALKPITGGNATLAALPTVAAPYMDDNEGARNPLLTQGRGQGIQAYENADQGGGIIDTTANAYEAPGGLKEVLTNAATTLNIETPDKLKGALQETGRNAVDQGTQLYDIIRGLIGNNAYVGQPQGPSSFSVDRPGEPAALAPPIASGSVAQSVVPQAAPATPAAVTSNPTPGLEPNEPPPIPSTDAQAQIDPVVVDEQMKALVLRSSDGEVNAQEDIRLILEQAPDMDDAVLTSMAEAIQKYMTPESIEKMGKQF